MSYELKLTMLCLFVCFYLFCQGWEHPWDHGHGGHGHGDHKEEGEH